ncbi:hypothetical protein GSI_04528 [Ganoderma sinense ZZ0214-1]|uniref:Uncharacterized protein n=1 Tax=Ganoderma sinense ZZ0214-1 TaxID=1077348 RepID=A0A2G8SH27_9APHY|nr:hypothetical protein GSI_04528 [Ganoderma sinense ZZ0214-1]
MSVAVVAICGASGVGCGGGIDQREECEHSPKDFFRLDLDIPMHSALAREAEPPTGVLVHVIGVAQRLDECLSPLLGRIYPLPSTRFVSHAFALIGSSTAFGG